MLSYAGFPARFLWMKGQNREAANMRISAVTIAIALGLIGQGATAQNLAVQTGRDGRESVPRSSVVRVQTQLQVSMPVSGVPTLDQQKGQQEAARRVIYEMAQGECRPLREVFGAECRLTSVSVNSNLQHRGAGAEMIVVSGSASYDLAIPVTAQ